MSIVRSIYIALLEGSSTRFSIIVLLFSFLFGTLSCNNTTEVDNSDNIQLSVLLDGIEELKEVQSIAYFDSKLFCVTGRGNCFVLDLLDTTIVYNSKIDFSPYSFPHANSCSMGEIDYSTGGFEIPFYISQWSTESERGVLVYKLSFHNNWDIKMVQVIIPDSSLTQKLGKGPIDWIVNQDTNKLYSVSYMNPGDTSILELNNNIIKVATFLLPRLEDGGTVLLHDTDVLDIFDIDVFSVGQDKVYVGGVIYSLSGSSSLNNSSFFRSISLESKQVDFLYQIPDVYGEPEGITYSSEGHFLLTFYGDNKLHDLYFDNQ